MRKLVITNDIVYILGTQLTIRLKKIVINQLLKSYYYIIINDCTNDLKFVHIFCTFSIKVC